MAVKCLELLSAELFEQALPLVKIDVLLISNYTGGMENFGLVTLSEEYVRQADDAHLIYLVMKRTEMSNM